MSIGEWGVRETENLFPGSLLETVLSFSGLNGPPGAMSCRFPA